MLKPKFFKKNQRMKFLSVFTLGLLAFSLLPDFFVPTTQVEAANSKVWTFQATNPSGGPTGGTTNSITDNTATITNGIYYWKVPHDGNYDINVLGANHVSYSGANMKGTFSLTSGQILKVLVGQQHITSGGVGGTFVTQNDNTPLIVAGGGGRRNSASLTTTGTSMSYGSSWTGTDVVVWVMGVFWWNPEEWRTS
jgi:tripartite motif-containing protein 56